MKKSLVLLCLGFVLVGCGEKNIINEYFVGEWSCNIKSYESIMEKGKFLDYLKQEDHTSNMKFKMENKELYLFDENSDQWIKNDMVSSYNGKTSSQETNGFNVQITGAILKKSDDEFHINNEKTIQNKDSLNPFGVKMKNEIICTRIK